MSDDERDSRGKHRRDHSEDDAEKSSKRHKHRRHHRHRHRSNKRDEEEEETKAAVEDVEARLPPPPSPPVMVLPLESSRPAEDVEEGEILDDDDGGLETKADSDAESGEISSPGARDNRIPGGVDDSGSPIVKPRKEDSFNGSLEKRRHLETGSPSKGGGHRKKYYSEDANDRGKLGIKEKSPYRTNGDMYFEGLHRRSRSGLRDHVRERSRSRSIVKVEAPSRRSHSRSILEEEALSKRRRYHDREITEYAEKRKAVHDSDEEGMVRDDDREPSIGYSRYSGLDRRSDKEKSRETETEMDRVRTRDKELERNSDLFRRRDKERERSIERDSLRDRKRGSGRGDSTDRESRREERHRSRDRTREDDADRIRSRVKDDKEREMERDRDRGRDRDRDQKRERRDDRYRDNGRVLERERNGSEAGYGARGKYDYSGQSRYEDKEYKQDGSAKSDQAEFQLERDEDKQVYDEEMVSLQVVDQEEEDLNRIKEESMRRKQAILEKYKNKQSQSQQDTNIQIESTLQQPNIEGQNKDILDQSTEVVKIKAEVNGALSSGGSYREEAAATRHNVVPGLGEGTPKSESSAGSERNQERSDDILCDDIFGETPTGVRKLDKGDSVRVERSGLRDNWDDAEGYYSYRFGELLDGRYEIAAAHGKGVFSTVVRAKNLKVGNGEPEEVAIKIIRSNDTMYKAGMTELAILKKLVGQDPDNKRYCVRFLSSFKYRNHLCLVFESLHLNLRELLKKFGRNIGLKLTAVRLYAKQLLVALKHLKNCGVLHCDIKPDNMLVNEAKNVLKLCDFGNAMFAGKNEVTPYLVSRFYRAPEIILGLPYDHPLDIWSVGCCLFELYTGKVLFPGATNNDMLRLHMELKGLFPKKMLRKGAFTYQNFDQDLNFHAFEDDPVTKKVIKRVILNIKPKDISSMISGSSGEDPDPKLLADFKDLLDKMFVLDPDKRLTVSQGLNHPFITGK